MRLETGDSHLPTGPPACKHSGSREVFWAAAWFYAAALKTAYAGLPKGIIERDGPVSEPVVGVLQKKLSEVRDTPQ